MQNLRIILDAGHYPEQAGKRSPILPDGRQFFEWEANWQICNRITELMPMANVHYLIKPSDRNARSIDRRAFVYNSLRAKYGPTMLIVSIHSNAAGTGYRWHPAHGIECYYWHTSETGKRCAQVFQNELITSLNWANRGIKPTKTLALLKRSLCPVVLTETGFFTNEEQVVEMLEHDYIEKTAEAHAKAIKTIQSLYAQGKITFK